MSFCTDTDLLYWEPNVLKDAQFASQMLLVGSGNLSGTTFTIASGSLVDAHIEAGQVVVLSGSVAGSFPIVSVNSATQMTISILYDGLDPAIANPVASGVGSATGLTFVIRTFWPQRRMVSDLVQQACGLDGGDAATSAIKNPEALRRVCALGTLQLIYSAMIAISTAPTATQTRADLYERLYRRALRSAKVELDLDGDGKADTVRALNVLELQRA